MSKRKLPFSALAVSGLAIHTVDKFPSNVGCRDDKQRDVAHVWWDSEGETETKTEDYEEARAWAELFAASPRLLYAAGMVADVSDYKLASLSADQLRNLITDLRNECYAAVQAAGLEVAS